jgi:putative flippase GtrA
LFTRLEAVINSASNFWTFSDKKITDLVQYPFKFIEFNILSLGSIVIQFVFLKVGEKTIGLKSFKEPFIDMPWVQKLPLVNACLKIALVKNISKKLSAYLVFYVAGVGTGLVVNYLIYSQIIWR